MTSRNSLRGLAASVPGRSTIAFVTQLLAYVPGGPVPAPTPTPVLERLLALTASLQAKSQSRRQPMVVRFRCFSGVLGVLRAV